MSSLRLLAGAPPLPPNVEVGSDCRVDVTERMFKRFESERRPGLRLGDRVDVYCWTTFAAFPNGSIEIGDDAILVGADIMCADRIEIGRGVVISYRVVIADADFHPRDPDERLEDAIAVAPGSTHERPFLESRPVVIEDDVWIGIGAIVLKGVNVGSGARVGPGVVVTSDVPRGARLGL